MNRTLTASLMMVTTLSLFACDRNTQKVEGPSKEKRFELSEKCYKYGKEYVAEFLRTQLDAKETYDEPEYHYSMKLNSCLVHLRTIQMMGPTSIHHSRLVDVFANKLLMHGYFRRDNDEEKLLEHFDDAPNFTAAAYFKEKDKYFSE